MLNKPQRPRQRYLLLVPGYLGLLVDGLQLEEGGEAGEDVDALLEYDQEFSNFRVSPQEVEKADWIKLVSCVGKSRDDTELQVTKGAAQALELFAAWLEDHQVEHIG